ncbi:MAG: hypothetical protein Ct9H300mP1_12450 [Planctomycetaceae bacterium]|nr:MAG: hypothetical protein Ct9H300mP1_12450 [Planctomycetaceae bacterium]
MTWTWSRRPGPPNNPDVNPGQLRSLLARSDYRRIVLQNFGHCSGGEQSKTALARLSALNANLLILDEPTNHLDLWARDGWNGRCANLPVPCCSSRTTVSSSTRSPHTFS